LSKSPKYFPDVEHANLEIAGAAERDRTRMAKGFPKPLRALDRIGGIRAADGFAGHDLAIGVVARHDHELGDLGHISASSLKSQNAATVFCLSIYWRQRPPDLMQIKPKSPYRFVLPILRTSISA